MDFTMQQQQQPGPVGPSSFPHHPSPSPQTNQNDVKLIDVQITDENVALNVMVSFLNLAHRRGAFALDESSKIFECIKRFQKSG